MKKSIYLIPALATMLFCSCEDFLDRDMINKVDAGKYFVDEKSLLNYANGFLVKYTSAATTLTYGDQNAEYVARTNLSSYYLDSYNATNQTGWGISDWNMLYNINYFLSHMREVSGVSEATLDHYEGVGRFWRAWFYWAKVKTFGGVTALAGVQFQLKKGEIHALMGENGAGKSTLMKCLFGMYSKNSGQIFLEGNEVNFKDSKEALENGVAMVHQELNQALKRNVMDNIWLGRYPKVAGVMVNEKKMYDDTMELFKKLEIDVDPKRIMSTMPVSQRQMAEIAKAVSFNSKIIVFDEPTSSLTEQEVEHLFRIINMLRDRGCGIIYISHKMEEILRISDEVTIMRDGQWIATRDAKTLTMNEIIKLMVGRELTNRYPEKDNVVGSPLLEVKSLTAMYSKLKDVSFVAKKGEVLGVAGLDSSGQSFWKIYLASQHARAARFISTENA